MINTVKKYLTETIKIYTVAETEDAYGGIYLARTLKATINGRVRQLNQTERYISDKNSEEVNARLYIKPTTAIAITDEIEHKSRVYRIERVNDVMNFDELLQVDLRLVQ